jgi:hypothetical protein
MKQKRLTFKTMIAMVWAICAGVFLCGMIFFGQSQTGSLDLARRNLLESRENLAVAQNAQKSETKQRTKERLIRAQESLDAFSCPAAAESALVFQIGQLAHTLALKQFTSRFPDNAPEQILEKSERIGEGWLTVEFIADYLALAEFINGLERHEPVLFVESIHLRRTEDSSEEAAVRMNLSYLIRKGQTPKTVALAEISQ